jgi:hypothetical protein
MSDDERDGAIVRRVREHLDRSADELDVTTRTRLRAARIRALDGLPVSRSLAGRRVWLTASVAISALGLYFAASWWLRTPEQPFASGGDLDDVEILTAADDLELYDELEFYRWLDDAEAI